ncbi:MAG: alanine racemase, partial [Myxococcota bacterium]|nr:alanine racemase [Myxococcota bacterium]
MAHLRDLPTPCLVLDRARLERNCARMQARASGLGVALRQHVKTAKSLEVARIAGAAGALDDMGPIAVSTLREAEHFVAHGARDITYAVGITPDRLARCGELVRRGARLRVITDDVAVAREIARAADADEIAIEVLIEIDVGQHRCGVDAESDALLAIADAVAAGRHARLAGVLAHAGHAYDASGVDALRAIAED